MSLKIQLLMVVLVVAIASSKGIVHAEETTHVTIQKQDFQNHLPANTETTTRRFLKGSELETKSEDGATDLDEERISFGLNRLKGIFHKEPNVAHNLAKNSDLAKSLEKSTDPKYLESTRTVRSYFDENPSMIRGLSLYEVEYLVAIVSLFVSIGALGVLIAIVAK